MKQLLCFGDSNTHGFNSLVPNRFEYNERWTGRLAKALGEDFHVIEAGLNGMTAGFDDWDKPNRNGQRAIGYFLHANKPIDFITVMVGTNDTKVKFKADEDKILENIEGLINLIKAHEQTEQNNTKILLIAPVPMDENAVEDEMDLNSVNISRNIGCKIEELAKKLDVYFADAGKWGIELLSDGCHFSLEGHRVFAEKIEKEIRKYI